MKRVLAIDCSGSRSNIVFESFAEARKFFSKAAGSREQLSPNDFTKALLRGSMVFGIVNGKPYALDLRFEG